MATGLLKRRRLWRGALLACALSIGPLGYAATPESAPSNPAASEAAGIEKALTRASQLLDRGDIQQSIELLEAILKRKPDNAEALFYLGRALSAAGQQVQALAAVKQSAALAPNNIGVRRQLAILYEILDRPDDALAQYRRVISLAPPGSSVARDAERSINLIIIRSQAQQGNFAGALALAEAAREAYADDPRGLAQLGEVYFGMNRFDDAEKIYKQAIALAPGKALLHYQLGQIHERQKRFAQAKEQYKRAMDLEPKSNHARSANIRLMLLRAEELVARNDRAAALKAYQDVLALDARHIVALTRSGELSRELNQLEEAQKIFEKVVDLTPKDFVARRKLAAIYLQREQLVKAVRQLEAIIVLAANQPAGANAEELLASIKRRYGAALEKALKDVAEQESLENQIRAQPDDLALRLELAKLYARNNMSDQAKQQLEEIIARDPNHVAAYVLLGEYYSSRNEFTQAAKEYALALGRETNPDKIPELRKQVLLETVRQLVTDQEARQAEALLQPLLEAEPEDLTLLFYRAVAQNLQGKFAEAERTYLRILELSPGHLTARANLARLYERLNREEDALLHHRYILQVGGSAEIYNTSDEAVPRLESRLNGLTAAVSYNIYYDSNSVLVENESDLPPGDPERYDVSSTLATNLVYNYKINQRMRLALATSPSFTIYHVAQSEFLRTDISPSLQFVRRTHELNMGASYIQIHSLLDDIETASAMNFSWSATKRLTWPAVPFWWAKAAEKKAAVSVLTLGATYADVTTLPTVLTRINPATGRRDAEISLAIGDATTFSGTVSFSQGLGGGLGYTATYGFTDYRNKFLAGSDYSYRGHNLLLRFDKSFTHQWTGTLAYELSHLNYANQDLTWGDKRQTWAHELNLSGSYLINRSLQLRTALTWQNNLSNLPSPVLSNRGNARTANLLEQSVSSAGSYHRTLLSASIVLRL